ncbi:MAG: hypothetical protein QOI65_287, partial [Thermoleophilaceae bacterium]|nr:hypothetical protein [Thermoleophilaceae bacterium]
PGAGTRVYNAPAGTSVVLTIPADRSPRRWSVLVTSGARVSVCPA